MTNAQRVGAEAFGTFWLVLGGCGTAVIAGNAETGVGTLGVSFAFGLTVLTMAFAVLGKPCSPRSTSVQARHWRR